MQLVSYKTNPFEHVRHCRSVEELQDVHPTGQSSQVSVVVFA